MTAAQMQLPGVGPSRQVRPRTDRRSPTFWVRRLRVLSELATGDEYVVRDVELRRGLNIVWAPPHSAGHDNALFRDGVAGHTAGKSTFCRLLRYILGERSFAPDGIRRRIRSKLPSAWVVGEVVITDTPWVVARPLAIGPHPFCLQGSSLATVAESTDRLEYQEFLNALAETTTRGLPAVRFPASDEPVRWEHVLPWLARDQECRFADFLEWRHSSSGSEAPSLTVDERQFIVRTVLGLISDAERAEQQKNAQLVAERKEAARLEPLLRHQGETDRLRLSRALRVELPLSSTPLFGTAARAELAGRRQELEQRENAITNSDSRGLLRAALEDASKNEGALKAALEGAQARLRVVQGSVEALAGNDQSGLLSTLPPSRDYCNVPLWVASKRGCPLAIGRPFDHAAKRSERTAAEELAAERQVLAALALDVKRLESAITTAQGETAKARREYLTASTAYAEEQSRLQDERSTLAQLEHLIRAAEEATKEAASKAESITHLTRDVEESYARQDKIREGQHAAFGRFGLRFDFVVRAIIGDKVTGRVDTSGRSLALAVEEHGERDSAAISTVKLLAFDLAAMISSIEGDGAFPRFLIHDGPREADMAPDVYERLFIFAYELEKCFDGEAGFQYIITTTTQPPQQFVVAPWLRLKLAGIPAEERLLGRDL